ncbi:hypothetical protein CAEBREN_31338 [Caenorhabditis brenneri]|uniref:Integrase catalytic domain-containing protein n=1 Tax=Caenorhabditis brenneri TaxID=135651 RepID=G0P1A3_CAEBE|nr:hypothetical protein CAEBREN_31338 [Caenorhabditis brenneri]
MVIQKFARRIQATVFKKRISVRLTDDQKVQDESSIQATSWNLEKILEHLEEIISMEEELEEHMSPKPDHKPDNNGKKNGNSDEKPTKAEPKSGKDKNKKYCFACKLETHWSSDCPTFPDPKQRTALLIADDRCTQCGRKGHLTNQCRKPACKVCQQPGHLRSNCPERTSSPKVAENGNNNSNSKKPTDGAKTNNGKPQTVAVVTRKEEADSEFIRTTAFQGSEGFKEEIAIIPTVKVKALNPRTQQWQDVSLMLDTGADTSYITAQLQEDWDLPILDSKTFAIRTFGDPNPTLKVRQRTEISLLTMRNKVFTVKPYIQPSLVGVIRKNPISPKDIRYAQLLELDVNEQCYEAKVEPDIIIGGDYFTRMTHGTHHTLPSGITLLDTIFGNTMMGVPFDDETIRESPEPIQEKYQFSIVQDSEYMSERNTEESQRKDMQMKAPGEHTGPLSEEITATEELTWQHFKNTVEKRPEGYFVRLHFKENHPPLPDNYAIAIRRLQSVGRNHSREVLQMVDNVFQDQIEKGIVEAVVEPRNSKPGIHYNAHQPVLTPQKQPQMSCLQFGHVTTDQNPADLGTRGIDRENFSRSSWWHGPKFLEDDPSQWTNHGLFSISEPSSELIRQVNVLYTDFEKDYEPIFDCSRTYNYGKMKRVAAYALKFIKKLFNCCSDTTKQKLELKIPFLREFTVSNQLSVQEIRLSEVTLLRDHQRGSFERKHFQKWNNLNLNINPIGLIISQGRLGHSELDDNAKFPILIAPNSDLAIQIVWDAHSKLHRSENHTISVILENFWIPQVRQLVRKLRRICVPCQRTLKAPFLYPNMGQLPSARVQRARPYENIGLDYFGPMQYRISAEEIGTAFGVIFTCSVSRLTHIEMAPDYSTRAFIQALRRFISLNGLPTSIVSDNAPAHILGEKMINESIIKETKQMSAEVIEFLAIHAIQWKFNTPYAPWQGGFFERLIRIVKEHLVRAIRTSILTYEELRTIFLEIAASMNSRPLTMPSSDNNSNPPMRPIDFVCPGRPMTLPVLDSDMLDEYLPSKEAQAELTKNETIRALENSMNATEEIWRRWHKEYLVQLRAHHKTRMDNKRGTPQHPKVDQVVLLCEDMQPRNYWRLAKITELVASADNEIREVLVETVTGKNQSQKSILRRSVNQVVPLEMDGSDDEEGNAEVPLKTSNDHKETPMVNQEEPRYNLRNRRKVNYNEAEESQSMVATSNSLGIPPITTLLSLCTLFMLFGNVTGSGASQLPTHAVCTPTGLQIRGYYESFEACVKEYSYTCSKNGQNCSLQDTCHCNPAENAMICSCKNEDLKDWFNQVDRRLPVHQGHWRLEQQNESIVAQMKHGATASLTIRLRDQWKTVKYITEDTCTVTHSPAIGCYSCENGATAEIFCKSEKTETFASIQCDRDAFAVKCTPDGHVSNITFFSEYSRFRKSCTVECGGPQQKIEINGMLKYTASIWTTIDRLVAGNTTLYNEWNLPDIGHIFESYLTMMKTIIIMMISVFAIFFFTYSIIVSTGVKTVKGILKLILMIILFPVTALVYLYFFGRRRLARNRHKTDHIA